ncbi:MAG TPA: hypothetical protein VHB20_11365, partial [Verrucomicrobiae bacterium]|nr:hypothetical protein [Verrucomicrobiae bacterium]
REVQLRLEYGYKSLLEMSRQIAARERLDASRLPGRIALYQVNGKYPAPFVSGIQTRMFYATYRGPGQELIKEAWEWVAGEERDYFIQRASEIIPLLTAQFAPVTGYWLAQGELPKCAGALEQSIGDFNRLYGATLPPDLWQIFEG